MIDEAKLPAIEQVLERMKEAYEKTMNGIITNVLEWFIREVEFFAERQYITDQCSNLLINDTQYIIKHL
ncbi:hypothetical protein KAW43_00980 [Candidatus Parcubacteria bacterium]|nr:hypothetical protein [Candidatus Parcubacteria bacterium]